MIVWHYRRKIMAAVAGLAGRRIYRQPLDRFKYVQVHLFRFETVNLQHILSQNLHGDIEKSTTHAICCPFWRCLWRMPKFLGWQEFRMKQVHLAKCEDVYPQSPEDRVQFMQRGAGYWDITQSLNVFSNAAIRFDSRFREVTVEASQYQRPLRELLLLSSAMKHISSISFPSLKWLEFQETERVEWASNDELKQELAAKWCGWPVLCPN